jgi:netrin-G3 ligand
VFTSNIQKYEIASGARGHTLLLLERHDLTGIAPGAWNGVEQWEQWAEKNIRELSIGDNNIPRIESGAFEGLSSVHKLQLGKNKIRQLDKGAFSHLPEVEALTLSGNEIQEIAPGAFGGMPLLRELKLDYNRLSIVTRGMLQDTSLCEPPIVTSNIRDEWKRNMAHACTLDLRGNQISTIENGTFAEQKSFNGRLDLSQNRLEELVGGMFEGLSELSELWLNSNPVQSIDQRAFDGLDKVSRLQV